MLFRRRLIDPRVVPTENVEVIQGHPLAPDRCYVPALGLRDLVGAGGAWAVGPSSPTIEAGSLGPAGRFAAGVNAGWKVGSGAFLGGHSAWTVCALVQTTASPSAYGSPIYSERGTSGNDILKLAYAGGGANSSPLMVYRDDGGSLVNPAPGPHPINDGIPRLATTTFDGSEFNSYVDDLLALTSSWGGTLNFTNSSVVQTIGYDAADIGANSIWTGDIIAVFLYRRALTVNQIAQLTVEPFAMLRPRAQMRSWTFPSGGVLPALTIDLSISAPTPTLTTSASLVTTLNTGATLSTPTLSSDVTVTVPLGSIVVDFSATAPVPLLTDATATVVTALSLAGVTPAPTLAAQATSASDFDLSAITPNAALLGGTYNMLTVDLATILPAPTLAATVTVAGNNTPTNVGQPMHLRSIQLIPYRVDDDTLKGLA